MNYGFVRVASATPNIKVGNCFYNAKNIINQIKEAYKNKATVICFTELCLTGYTCSDLFFQDSLLDDSKKALKYILEETKDIEITCIVGMPLEYLSKLYNCAVCFYKGNILGIVPKQYLPNYNEFYEKRQFNTLNSKNNFFTDFDICNDSLYFGKIIFEVNNIKNFKFAIEICEDLWATIPPSSTYVLEGATVIFNLSASNEIAGKSFYRRELVKNQSARGICAYVYTSAGDGESTTDLVFSGHNMIYENGRLVSESKLFENGILYGDIDLEYLNNERRKNTTFNVSRQNVEYIKQFEIPTQKFDIFREISKTPFIPESTNEIDVRSNEIINIQAYALKKRIEHIGIKNVVIGISGGLDSTHALIVVNKCYEILGYDKKGIITVTMPCFGTTDRTLNNAKKLCNILKTTLLEINIKDAVMKHFEDINHNIDVQDVTYENSQARERTQVLMDIANKYNAIVIGTGDLSELALGFATYNGDHMSMYGVNCSIPKTLIKYLIKYVADNSKDDLKEVLFDILNTPISPELLPHKDGEITQITEDIIGSYELHDFFLYYMIRHSYDVEKIYYLSKIAFKEDYNDEVILKCLEKFYFRFYTQQFKRSCLPDGVKVGSVSLSPRGDLKMPSDFSFESVIKKIEKLKKLL